MQQIKVYGQGIAMATELARHRENAVVALATETGAHGTQLKVRLECRVALCTAMW